LAKFVQILVKVIKSLANLIRYGQNQNLASLKHSISFGYGHIWPRFYTKILIKGHKKLAFH